MLITLNIYNLCRLSIDNAVEQDVFEASETTALENINEENNTEEMWVFSVLQQVSRLS